MILKHILIIFSLCGGIFIAGMAFSAVEESFDKDSFADLVNANVWNGDGTLVEESPAPLAAGRPIGTAENDTPKVLALEGQVLCSSSTGKQTDFLLNVSGPSDELPPPENLVGVQIAVAAGTELDVEQNVPLMLYCNYRKDDGEEASGWLQVSSVKVDTWIRVTMDFDYNNDRCKVSVDGVPVVSEKGSLKADGTGGKGAWYKLAAKASGTIASLTFVGSAKIDDVVINDEVSGNCFAQSAKAEIAIADGVKEEVSLNDLNKWGITPDMAATTQVDDSGLTVAQKLECGLKPDDGKKFQLTSMEMRKVTVDGVDKTVATIKFPGSDAAIRRYKVTARNAKGETVSVESSNAQYSNGEVNMDVAIPDDAGRIIFINVTADASTQQSAGN